MALLRRIGTRIVIYLDDMIIGKTREKTMALRNTAILLLQCLGFVINQSKSVITLVQEIEFLGMIVNSKKMTISLPQKRPIINKTDVSGFVSKSNNSLFAAQKKVFIKTLIISFKRGQRVL